ncbi:hypothetical protein SteCoe_38444 [Stentor coeruleus]|uniref:Uncharacterized protein n=1 Tax=Stentor coeruleus TaxID=5963 RepID=A0A1R2ALE4_9CILI|nr:hypothetical protein SteCoe_38444 [Stentor coeruleus]
MGESSEDVIVKIRKLSSIDERPSLSDSTLEILIENIIQNLSNLINAEFNKNSGTKDENLFCVPDMLNETFLSKAQLARDLSELLYNCKSKRESILSNQPYESLRNYRPSNLALTTQDIFSCIFNGSFDKTKTGTKTKPSDSNTAQEIDSLYLNGTQAEELLSIIQEFSAVSESNKYRMPLSTSQKEFILISKKIDEILKTLRQKEDEHDYLDTTNKKLNETIALLKQQERNFDKQLEDSMAEYFLYEEHKKNLENELEEARNIMKQLKENRTPFKRTRK